MNELAEFLNGIITNYPELGAVIITVLTIIGGLCILATALIKVFKFDPTGKYTGWLVRILEFLSLAYPAWAKPAVTEAKTELKEDTL